MKKATSISRRKFALGSAATIASFTAAPAIVRAAAKELRVLTWEGYAEPDWVDPFKAATGADVSIVYTGATR